MTFNNKTIDELHDLLVKKEISALELTKATLEDIKSREGAVDAFLTITEDKALAQAAALDEKGIDADNVMAGIPLAVKDNISTKGILTTAASKMLYNYEPIFDATSVAQAYAKDMIIVGKTNMDEFAMGGSNENSAFKPTKNAWDQKKSSWWFFRWFSRCSCVRSSPFVIGFRHWWFDSSASILQWDCRDEAYLWYSVTFWLDCLWLIT